MRIGFLFGIALFLDQATKMVIRHTMVMGDSIPVIGQVFRITYIENPGIAFGIRVGNGSLFTVLSILASFGILFYLFTHRRDGMGVKGGLALILGGAIGNLVDRILYRQVVDFIDVGIGNLRWPVFNVADSAVVIGMAAFIFSVFISERNETKLRQEGVGKVV